MKRWLLLAAFTVGCSSSPTAPTPDPPVVAVPTVPPNTLRWDMIAEGCTVARPVPLLTDRAPDQRVDSPTSVRALWLMSTEGNRRTYIEGTFQRSGEWWAICSWDTLIRETIASASAQSSGVLMSKDSSGSVKSGHTRGPLMVRVTRIMSV